MTNTAAMPINSTSPSQPQLTNFLPVAAPTLFAAHKLFQLEIVSLRALRIHFNLHDIYGRRRIGRHRLYRIDPLQVAKGIGSDNRRRNHTEIRRLFDLGLWKETSVGICPAQDLDDLKIDPEQISAIQDWLRSNKLGRRTVNIPRRLLAAMPRFSHAQIGIALELIRRATWEGDASETTATTWLRISEVASRWGLDPRTVQRTINGMGGHVRFELVPTHWFHRQKFGNRYRVVVGSPSVPSALVHRDESPLRPMTPPLATQCTPAKSAQVLPPPPAEFAQVLPPPENLLCNPFQVDKNQSCNPLAAGQSMDQDPGGERLGICQNDEDKSDPDRCVDTALVAPTIPVETQGGCQGGDTTAADTPPDTTPAPDAIDVNTSDPAIPAPRASSDVLPTPDLKHVIAADLRDMSRLEALREQAIDAGYIRRNSADRLAFVGAAVHAREEGSNPPGMFVAIVSKGLWSHITTGQEDRANAMIKAYDFGGPPPHLRLVPRVIPPPVLSEDARTVEIARKWLLAERYRGDPFLAFKRLDVGRDWTRARWEAACVELDARRC